MNVSGPKQLITDERDHAKEHLSKVRKEIKKRKEMKLFEDLQIRENEKTDRVISEHAGKNPASLGLAKRSAADEIDRGQKKVQPLYERCYSPS
jgi:hypothetical protein